jgi:hypothetical protein
MDIGAGAVWGQAREAQDAKERKKTLHFIRYCRLDTSTVACEGHTGVGLLHRGFAERRSILARARAVHANIIHNLGRPGRPRHARGCAFVLGDSGISFPRHHAVLNMEAKSILSNFRFS